MIQMIFIDKPQGEKNLSLLAQWIKMVKNPIKPFIGC